MSHLEKLQFLLWKIMHLIDYSQTCQSLKALEAKRTINIVNY